MVKICQSWCLTAKYFGHFKANDNPMETFYIDKSRSQASLKYDLA